MKPIANRCCAVEFVQFITDTLALLVLENLETLRKTHGLLLRLLAGGDVREDAAYAKRLVLLVGLGAACAEIPADPAIWMNNAEFTARVHFSCRPRCYGGRRGTIRRHDSAKERFWRE